MSINSEFFIGGEHFPDVPKKLAWESDALCAQTDPEAFFPEDNGLRDAKKVCAQCKVGRQCLQYALDNNQTDGVWGGMSNGQRNRLKGKSKEEIDKAFEANQLVIRGLR